MLQRPRRVQLRNVLQPRQHHRLDAEEVGPCHELPARLRDGLGGVRGVLGGQEGEVEGARDDDDKVEDREEGDG